MIVGPDPRRPINWFAIRGLPQQKTEPAVRFSFCLKSFGYSEKVIILSSR